MNSLSIRSRLSLWYALVMLVGFSVFGFGMWLALEHRLVAGVDAHLAQRMKGVKNALGGAEIRSRDQLQQELSEFAAEIPDGTLVQLRDRSGSVLLPDGHQSKPLAGGDRLRILTGRLESAGETWDVTVAGKTRRDGAGLRGRLLAEPARTAAGRRDHCGGPFDQPSESVEADRGPAHRR